MAATLRRQGKTLSQQLDTLYDRYGFFTTSNSYFICRDSAKTDRIFSQLRYGTEVSSCSLCHTILRADTYCAFTETSG